MSSILAFIMVVLNSVNGAIADGKTSKEIKEVKEVKEVKEIVPVEEQGYKPGRLGFPPNIVRHPLSN